MVPRGLVWALQNQVTQQVAQRRHMVSIEQRPVPFGTGRSIALISRLIFYPPCQQVYRDLTLALALPPKLLFTVMFCGLLGQENFPTYPVAFFLRLPMRALVDVT